MYPMDFEEFLMATSSQGLIDEIYRCYNEVIPEMRRSKKTPSFFYKSKKL